MMTSFKLLLRHFTGYLNNFLGKPFSKAVADILESFYIFKWETAAIQELKTTAKKPIPSLIHPSTSIKMAPTRITIAFYHIGILMLLGAPKLPDTFTSLPLPQYTIISDCYAEDTPFILPKREEIHKLKSALVKTDRGDLWFELFPEIAPWHVVNLKYLADIGFYRNIPFKHYFEGYIIQTDNSSSNSQFKYSIPAEFSDKLHDIGTLGMARFPDGANPDRRSDATRFHIILGRSSNLDGSYTIFGQLINGYTTLKKLRPGDRIKEVKVFVREN